MHLLYLTLCVKDSLVIIRFIYFYNYVITYYKECNVGIKSILLMLKNLGINAPKKEGIG